MQVKEEELRAVLSPAGFVWELTVPRSPDGASHTPPCADCMQAGTHPSHNWKDCLILPNVCLHCCIKGDGGCLAWA